MTLFSLALPVAHHPSLFRFADVWRQRQALTRLDDRALEDIGLSYREASAEARRPIWDAPRNWVR